MISPQIQVMSRVQHQSVEDGTFYYRGHSLANWSQQMQLINVIKAIQYEFNQVPPKPLHASSAQRNVQS
jgi:hypothetical protein